MDSFRLDRKMLTIKVVDANEDMHPVIENNQSNQVLPNLLSAKKREGRKNESKEASPMKSGELKALESLNNVDTSLNSIIDIVTMFPKS